MKSNSEPTKKQGLWYIAGLFILAAAALVLTVIPYVADIGQVWEGRLGIIGKIIYAVFLLDFVYFWFKADCGKNYVRDNWVSLIVVFTPLKGLKALKGLKGLKGLKALKGFKALKVFKLGKKLSEETKE